MLSRPSWRSLPTPCPALLCCSDPGEAVTSRGTLNQIHRKPSLLPLPLHMHQAGGLLPFTGTVGSRINIPVGSSSLAHKERGVEGAGTPCVPSGRGKSASD